MKMKGSLTENEAALIYCIIGNPNGYPTVEEALACFNPLTSKKPANKKKDNSEEAFEGQLSFF